MKKSILYILFTFSLTITMGQDMSKYMKKYIEQGNVEKIKEILNIGYDINEPIDVIKKIPINKHKINGTYKAYKQGRIPYESMKYKTEILEEKIYPVELLMKSNKHSNHLEILKLFLSKGLNLSESYNKIKKTTIVETRKGSQYNTISLENEPVINRDKNSIITQQWNNKEFIKFFNINLIPSIKYLIAENVKFNPNDTSYIKQHFQSKKNEAKAKYIVALGDVGLNLGNVYTDAKKLLNKKNELIQEQKYFDEIYSQKLTKNEILKQIEINGIRQPVFNFLVANEDSTFVKKLIESHPEMLNSSLNKNSNFSKKYNYWGSFCPLSYALYMKDEQRFNLLLKYGANPTYSCVKNLSNTSEMSEFLDFEKAKFNYKESSESKKELIDEVVIEDELNLNNLGEILETNIIFSSKNDLAKLNLASGKKYLIVFNSSPSWCKACKSQLKHISEFNKNIDFNIIHILIPSPTKKYQEQLKFDKIYFNSLKNIDNIPILYIKQHPKHTHGLIKDFDTKGFPFSVFIDDFKVKYIFSGAISYKEINDAVK